MNTSLFPVTAFLAVLAAILTFPVGAAAAAFALTATGVLAVLAADYGRALDPVRLGGELVPFTPPARQAAGLRTAA